MKSIIRIASRSAGGVIRRHSNSSADINVVFDRTLKRQQRDWSFVKEESDYYDYLRIELAERIVDRLDDINKNFPLALEIGCHRGFIYNTISSRENLRGEGGAGGVQSLVQCDMSSAVIKHIKSREKEPGPADGSTHIDVKSLAVQCDEEKIPFEDSSFDLVLSSMYLHWVNDLPSTLKKIRSILRPDGAFIGCLLGGNTLQELKHCLFLAEQERKGGFASHASAFASASDIAGLMQSAGFSLPTIDVDTITIAYPDAFALMEHLQRMGESTASLNRHLHVGRDTFMAAAAIYRELYGLEDGSIPATFQVIYAIGWSPHDSQPKPCKRGSGSTNFKDVLGKTI